MDSNSPTVFYSNVFHVVEQCRKSCAKFPLIFHPFLKEINVLIYQDGFVFDFLACAVISGTQKPISSSQTLFENYFMLFWTKKIDIARNPLFGGIFALEIDERVNHQSSVKNTEKTITMNNVLCYTKVTDMSMSNSIKKPIRASELP